MAKFQRDGEPQGLQRFEDLRRPAGTGSSGRVAGTGNCGSFSIGPSNECSGLTSFRIHWLSFS